MKGRTFLAALLLLACGFAAGLVVHGRMRPLEPAGTPQAGVPLEPAAAAPPASVSSPTIALPDFSRIAERTVPAVVNVASVQYVERRLSPYANDPFYQFFYGTMPGLGTRRPIENSLGSGVIVSADGYILTNNHVVTGERRRVALRDLDITVALADKREMPATVVGVDDGTDLALLKVDANDLPVMPWGDSQRLKVAEWVLAIGNPYQLSETVTLGIVSAVGRKDVGINMYEDFIQTDAAINPGNSGGALVNAGGELVGINTAIFSQSGGYQGIGFAVAGHLARKVMSDLRQYGEVRRGTINGIAIEAVTPRIARQLQAPDTRGAVVVQTVRGLPTFKPGDIILEFNGTEIAEPRQLVRLVGEAAIGSTATITALREGRRVEIRVPIEQQKRGR
jgi:S1-C subfamily serine protease